MPPLMRRTVSAPSRLPRPATISTTGQATLHGADIAFAGSVNLASRLTLDASVAGASQTSGSITVNELHISGSLTYQDLAMATKASISMG